ncbi:hypothetical protein Mal65_25760 [Crateriforma conspicua]|nr:hypothetical protein Mal65_25760 [Crateriforma conspicua]
MPTLGARSGFGLAAGLSEDGRVVFPSVWELPPGDHPSPPETRSSATSVAEKFPGYAGEYEATKTCVKGSWWKMILKIFRSPVPSTAADQSGVSR